MDMTTLRPVAVWGELRGNEDHISGMVPVFRDSEGIPYTTGIGTGNWKAENLKPIRGQEDYFNPYPELEALTPEGFAEGWNLWTVGSRLEAALEAESIGWRSELPEGRATSSIRGFSCFVATPTEERGIRSRLRIALNRIWIPVLQDPSLASERTARVLEVVRRLDMRGSIWDRLSYYYLTGDDESLSWELRLNELRRWEDGEWGDREWVAARIEERLEASRSGARIVQGRD